MPELTQELKELLGPLVLPFERSKDKVFDFEDLKSKGEAHKDDQGAIHNGINNNLPKDCLIVTVEERDKERILKGRKFKKKCYLWVIDNESVKIILERTPNILRGSGITKKNYVCHTNITACQRAFTGGEMYFCEDDNIYMNFSSDRYGYRGNDERKQYVITAMEHMLYKNIILLKDYY